MTDRTATTDEAERTSDAAEQDRTGTDGGTDPTAGETSVFEQLQWGALVLLVVAAVVSAAQFYRSATRSIAVWVGPGYQPLVMAAFNLVVLLLAAAGISVLARRLGSVPA